MKPIYRFDIEQNTDEWHAERVRRIGASSAPSLLMDKKTVGYNSLLDRLVEETITGEVTESKQFKGTPATERGHYFEPIARIDYEFRKLQSVKIIGMVILDDWVMCSPDGLINEDKLHQIKCPIFNTQRKYLQLVKKHEGLTDNEILKKIDSGYYKQCQYELHVSDRSVNIWTSFHPMLPPIDLTITRDESLITEIKQRLSEIKAEALCIIDNLIKP